MKDLTRWRRTVAVALTCCMCGCTTSLSNNRALFKPREELGYVEGRSDEIKNLYWAQRSLATRDPDPQLKRKLTQVVVPAHYDSDGELIEAHREVIEVVQ